MFVEKNICSTNKKCLSLTLADLTEWFKALPIIGELSGTTLVCREKVIKVEINIKLA